MLLTKMRFALLVWLSALVCAMPLCMAWAQMAMSKIQLRAGTHSFTVEVAATLDSRDQGLMGRHSLPVNRGMLFVFPEAHRHCMWMRHTSIPLSVAFIGDKGEIINIADMKPHTEDYHCADRPVRYALEMNRGWFKRHGAGAGTHIGGLGQAPPGQ